jgi:chromosomal replication initiation ATPase DnaA
VSAQLNPQHRFDTLVVGAANRLAVTAARAVAEAPGAVYNPLCIYAPPGLGKTHLLMALGHAVRTVNPNVPVEYLTLDGFVESYTAAVGAGQGDAFRRRFTEVGVLLLDDVQFLGQHREMQAELLRAVDAMQAAGRQIVLTSDRPPGEIESLDERLLRRFGGGLVIDMTSPDYETRAAILRRRAEERKANFERGVLEAVAALAIDNVRELIGALNRLIAFQAVSDRPIDAEQAVALVGGGRTREAAPAAPGEAGEPLDDGFIHVERDDVGGEDGAPAEAGDRVLGDEFTDFLSEVTATVAQQVESWRSRLAAAIGRWDAEGYDVARLEAAVAGGAAGNPDAALAAYEADVARLQALEAEAVALSPEVAGTRELRNPADLAGAEALLDRLRTGTPPPPAPSAGWRLDEFGEGQNNRMAVRSAQAVVDAPGARYNPLVLVGPTGTGKTHLLHGIGNALAARGIGPVACLDAHDFTAELIDAIDRNAVPAWQARYRRSEAFLLDDVHLLAGRDRTQDELFTLFNLLLESGRQMVFASTLPLAELAGIEPRLLTRLEGGLVVDLPAPDRDTRRHVAERALAAHGAEPDPELLGYLASRPAESSRAVQGMVQRLLGAAEAKQAVPTPAFARELLEGPARAPRRSTLRTSGVVAPTGGGLRSREKTVWEWPDVGSRIVEEWR